MSKFKTPQVQDIAKNLKPTDPDAVAKAHIEMAKVTDASLYFSAFPDDWPNSHSVGVALARIEIEKRKAKQTATLTLITAVLSGGIGVAGVVVGILLERNIL